MCAPGPNDAHRAGVIAIVRELLANGAPVTVLGDQAHMNMPLTPIARVLEAWNELSALGLPIELTELDVTLGGPRDEASQGRYFEDYVTAAFSHPNIRSVVLWGFWDGAHWLASQGAGLFRLNWSPRPMAESWERLFLRDWWSREEGTTGEEGEWSGRVFLGEHDVVVGVGERSVSRRVRVSRGGEGVEVVVVEVGSSP
jgi:hypothetical protein